MITWNVDKWRCKFPKDLFMYHPALKKWQDDDLDIEEQEDDVLFDVPHVLNKMRETLLLLHQSKKTTVSSQEVLSVYSKTKT